LPTPMDRYAARPEQLLDVPLEPAPVLPYHAPTDTTPDGLGAGRPNPAHVGILLVVSLIWGTTFMATRLLVAGDAPALSPGGLVFWRFLIAGVALLAFLPRASLSGSGGAGTSNGFPFPLWLAGLELSLWLWAGYATQAIGLQYTTVTRSAFVTSLNVVFVPVMAVLAGGRVGPVV
jgi:drug/metabolite transporter (DMT)-like permease